MRVMSVRSARISWLTEPDQFFFFHPQFSFRVWWQQKQPARHCGRSDMAMLCERREPQYISATQIHFSNAVRDNIGMCHDHQCSSFRAHQRWDCHRTEVNNIRSIKSVYKGGVSRALFQSSIQFCLAAISFFHFILWLLSLYLERLRRRFGKGDEGELLPIQKTSYFVTTVRLPCDGGDKTAKKKTQTPDQARSLSLSAMHAPVVAIVRNVCNMIYNAYGVRIPSNKRIPVLP